VEVNNLKLLPMVFQLLVANNKQLSRKFLLLHQLFKVTKQQLKKVKKLLLKNIIIKLQQED
jgi:hypothetical protein